MFRSKIAVFVVFVAGLGMALPALAQPPVVAPEHVPDYWNMTKSEVSGDVPNLGRKLDQPGCVAVSYMIGSDGVPQHVKARKVVPSGSDFGYIAVSLVRNFRYAASSDNNADQPINTYYVVRFNMPKDAARQAALLKQCKLSGYGD
jgi:hypothetical protein